MRILYKYGCHGEDAMQKRRNGVKKKKNYFYTKSLVLSKLVLQLKLKQNILGR